VDVAQSSVAGACSRPRVGRVLTPTDASTPVGAPARGEVAGRRVAGARRSPGERARPAARMERWGTGWEDRERVRTAQPKRRGSKPLEEPLPSDPRVRRLRWRGLTPRWPRSLRLGTASGFNVRLPSTACKTSLSELPHIPKISSDGAR
jgi:hypothetical protein